MNTTEKAILEVPGDVMVDIARVILQADLQHRITGADAEKNIVCMEVCISKEKESFRQNIFDIIDSHNFFRYE